jgi:hypothetical protein
MIYKIYRAISTIFIHYRFSFNFTIFLFHLRLQICLKIAIFRKEYEQMDITKRGDLLIHLSRIEDEGGLTAMDFFTVDRSTICSLVSTILTYFLILIQYQPPKNN